MATLHFLVLRGTVVWILSGWGAPQCHTFKTQLLPGKKKSLSYLNVFERDPPLIGWIFRRAWDEQGPAEVGDGLTAVRVLGGGVNVSAAVKRGFGPVVLQLHGVQREPAACRHLVVTLAHSKAGYTHAERSAFCSITESLCRNQILS